MLFVFKVNFIVCLSLQIKKLNTAIVVSNGFVFLGIYGYMWIGNDSDSVQGS